MNEVIELAKVIHEVSGLPLELCGAIAQDLVERGYSKSSEGEWVKNDHGDTICSRCRLPVNYKSNYCPDCGSRNVLGQHGLWHRDTDWPPESDGRYLLATDRGEMLVGEWKDGLLLCEGASQTTVVKWWMPAPELPEGL